MERQWKNDYFVLIQITLDYAIGNHFTHVSVPKVWNCNEVFPRNTVLKKTHEIHFCTILPPASKGWEGKFFCKCLAVKGDPWSFPGGTLRSLVPGPFGGGGGTVSQSGL